MSLLLFSMILFFVMYTLDMYPRDAITVSVTIKSAGTYTLIPSTSTPYTILSGTVSGTGAGGDEQGFILGTSTIYSKGDVSTQSTMHLVYSGTALKIFKSGSASTTFAVTYVPRNRNNTYDPDLYINSSSSIGTSSISISNEMTTVSYIYLIMATVALLLFVFKRK